MVIRVLRAVLVSAAMPLTLGATALGAEPLDLTIDPKDVEKPKPPVLMNLETAKPMFEEPGLGDPGWSVEPEIELDVEALDEDGGTLPSLDTELESLGVRLKRTW